jgi:phosphoglucosamine mutase
MSEEQEPLFGTDGIRGVANQWPLTPELALAAGRAFAEFLQQNEQAPRHDNPGECVVVGRDTRISGQMLESALCAGLTAGGLDVRLTGILPTPGVAALTRTVGGSGGVMISASHNPFQDNGLKFFNHDGFKLTDAGEAFMDKRIRELLSHEGRMEAKGLTGADLGRVRAIDNSVGQYVKFVRGSLPTGFRLDGLHVVLDCANGAAWETSPLALRELGAEVDVKCAEPDGININAGCGSTFPEQLAELVKESGARVGISHDGDADRLVMCDETGTVLDGDELLAIAALSLLDRGELARNTLVATVMSNFGLEKALEPHEGRVVRTKVGDRPVLEEMLRGGYSLGGEQSGHIIFRDYHTTGDGLLSALQILRIMRERGEPLSRLRQVLKKYPQEQRNVRVTRKPALETLENTQSAVEKAQVQLGNTGRVLLRYSGTEPKLRILVEGQDSQQISKLAETIADAARSEIGAER